MPDVFYGQLENDEMYTDIGFVRRAELLRDSDSAGECGTRRGESGPGRARGGER